MITLRIVQNVADSPASNAHEVQVPTLADAHRRLSYYRDEELAVVAYATDADGTYLGMGQAHGGEVRSDWETEADEVGAAEAAFAIADDQPARTMSAQGVEVDVLAHGGAAIPTAADLRRGLALTTWAQLGAKVGDQVEAITPNDHVRVRGTLGAERGQTFITTDSGRRFRIGGRTKRIYAARLASH